MTTLTAIKRVVGFKNKTGRTLSFAIKIEEKECINFETLQREPMQVLSICKSDRKNGVACQTDFSKYVNTVQKKYLANFLELETIWRKYHLNDLQAGTSKQVQAVKEWRKENNIKGFAYDEEKAFLQSIDLLEDNGVKWGYGWYCKQLPVDVIEYLKTVEF